MLPDLPQFEPVNVPLWLYVTTCTILGITILAALISDWRAAGKNRKSK